MNCRKKHPDIIKTIGTSLITTQFDEKASENAQKPSRNRYGFSRRGADG
jgi:hypothetical protein